MGLEGIVSKRKDGRYESGRTSVWTKSPCKLRETFAVAGWARPPARAVTPSPQPSPQVGRGSAPSPLRQCVSNSQVRKSLRRSPGDVHLGGAVVGIGGQLSCRRRG